MIRAIVIFLVRTFCYIVFRVGKIGKENVPRTGAYIMCANHTSNWDPPIIVACTNRKMHIMAKAELFKNKFICWFAEKCWVFPVKRGGKDIESMKHSLKVLKDGEMLMLFPEGTRNKTKEFLLPFKFGAVSMASKTDSYLVPFGITGDYVFRSKNLVIRYGKPFKVGDMSLEEANQFLHDEVEALMKQNLNM